MSLLLLFSILVGLSHQTVSHTFRQQKFSKGHNQGPGKCYFSFYHLFQQVSTTKVQVTLLGGKNSTQSTIRAQKNVTFPSTSLYSRFQPPKYKSHFSVATVQQRPQLGPRKMLLFLLLSILVGFNHQSTSHTFRWQKFSKCHNQGPEICYISFYHVL